MFEFNKHLKLVNLFYAQFYKFRYKKNFFRTNLEKYYIDLKLMQKLKTKLHIKQLKYLHYFKLIYFKLKLISFITKLFIKGKLCTKYN